MCDKNKNDDDDEHIVQYNQKLLSKNNIKIIKKFALSNIQKRIEVDAVKQHKNVLQSLSLSCMQQFRSILFYRPTVICKHPHRTFPFKYFFNNSNILMKSFAVFI